MNDKISKKAVWESVDIEDSKGTTPSLHVQFCYKCGMEIPPSSEFCPSCGIQLFLDCPKCKHKFLSKYAFCPKCGTNREIYLAEEKKRRESSIAEQKKQELLKQKQLEEERKQALEEGKIIRYNQQLLREKQELLKIQTKYRTPLLLSILLLIVSLITLLVCVIDVVCSLTCTIPKTDEVCYKITGLEYSSGIPFYIHYEWNYDELLVGKTFKVKRGTDEFSYEMTSCDTTIILNESRIFKRDNSYTEFSFFSFIDTGIANRPYKKKCSATFFKNETMLFTIEFDYMPHVNELSLNINDILDVKSESLKSVANQEYKVDYYEYENYILLDNINVLDSSISDISDIRTERRYDRNGNYEWRQDIEVDHIHCKRTIALYGYTWKGDVIELYY